MTKAIPASDKIVIRSHVRRDLLQNAAVFKTDKLVVWEYVSNGLQYVDPGTSPVVRVRLDTKGKRIRVSDNGRGMDWAGLDNYFVMHGENVDRKEGRPGRGMFGTGKSAAFGIADVLRITTVRNGKRSQVEVRRSNIKKMESEHPIPVQTIEREVPVEQPNGTLVEIEDIHLGSLDRQGVINYIERNLAKGSKNWSVFVNNYECEYAEPPVSLERRYPAADRLAGAFGPVELILRASKAPLPDELKGVSIYSNGVLHETTLVGAEGRDMSQYIFGEIDVPLLDQDDSPIPPFDLSRSMQLNPSNSLVQSIYAFIGPKIDELRRELLGAERERRKSEEARRLAREAEEIAQLINEDFNAWRHRVAKARAKASGGLDAEDVQPLSGDLGEDLVSGGDEPAEITSLTGDPGHGHGQAKGGKEPPDLAPQLVADPNAEQRGARAGGDGARPKPRGGFRVEFDSLGAEEFRARYVREERTIYINLEHPQIVAAKGLASTEEPAFRRLAYEVAFSEYAVALASELAARDEYLDPTDPILDIRDTINRLARRAAQLYAE